MDVAIGWDNDEDCESRLEMRMWMRPQGLVGKMQGNHLQRNRARNTQSNMFERSVSRPIPRRGSSPEYEQSHEEE